MKMPQGIVNCRAMVAHLCALVMTLLSTSCVSPFSGRDDSAKINEYVILSDSDLTDDVIGMIMWGFYIDYMSSLGEDRERNEKMNIVGFSKMDINDAVYAREVFSQYHNHSEHSWTDVMFIDGYFLEIGKSQIPELFLYAKKGGKEIYLFISPYRNPKE